MLNRADEQASVRVLTMYDEVALRFDTLDDGVDGEGEHEGAGGISLLCALLTAEMLVAKT